MLRMVSETADATGSRRRRRLHEHEHDADPRRGRLGARARGRARVLDAADDVCLQELLTAARGNVTTLQQAREILPELAVADAVAGQRSGRLLELAALMALERSGVK
jgi:hypothetical protein